MTAINDEPMTTHRDGCWRHHLGCAVALVEMLDARLAAAEAELEAERAKRCGTCEHIRCKCEIDWVDTDVDKICSDWEPRHD